MMIAVWFTGQAYPHDATLRWSGQPLGWAYPYSCCSGYDCREVPGSTVKEDGRGGYIVPSGENITRVDVRIKESPDGLYHWCTEQGRNDTRTICLYVPPPSY